MKKVFLTFTLVAFFFGSILLTACGGNANNKTTNDEDSTEVTDEVGHAVGTIPLDFPAVGTDAVNGDFVLTPSLSFIDDAWKDPESISFIFYSSTMTEPGEKESKVNQTGTDVMIPNSLIIPIPSGQEAHNGDIVLTWWQSGSGLEKAIVVDDADPSQPVVVYLDASYDENGDNQEQLKANSFVVITDEWQTGTSVAYAGDYNVEQWMVIRIEGDKVLAKGWGGSMAVLEKSKCTPIPVNMKVAVGDVIQIPYIGSYQEGTVTKVDEAKGRIWVETEWGGETVTAAVCPGDITTGLTLKD